MLFDVMAMADPMIAPPLDVAAEKSKLGKNADNVVGGVWTWVNGLKEQGHLSDGQLSALVSVGKTAEGIRALNVLRTLSGEREIPVGFSTDGDDMPSTEEWYAMRSDPKFETDPAFRQKWSELGKKLFGTDPAGTSQRGVGLPRGSGSVFSRATAAKKS